MNFSLDEKYLKVQQDARELCKSIAHIADEADEYSTVHPDIHAALKSSELSRMMVPAEYGGSFDKVDPLAICLTREVMMTTSCHLDSLYALQGIGSFGITVAGTNEQREHWLPKVASAEALAGLALTEEDAGSDLKAASSTIVDSAEGLRLNGSKAFISNAGSAAFYEVLAKEGDSFSMVLLPADAEGLSISAAPELIAPHVLGDLHFDNVLLPHSARLGEAGKGLDLVMATLAVFRVSVAGAAIGLAQTALEEAVRHTRTRIQFGRPLARLGPVAQMLADSWTEIEMARLLTYRAASMAKDNPAATLQHSSMAKLAASEAASKVVDRCVQVMGRFGLIRGSKIEKLYRQARPMRIYEGSSEVLRLGIARELTEIVD